MNTYTYTVADSFNSSLNWLLGLSFFALIPLIGLMGTITIILLIVNKIHPSLSNKKAATIFAIITGGCLGLFGLIIVGWSIFAFIVN